MMRMPNFQALAMNLLKNNPKVANNPQAQNFINVIQQGDSAKGEEIANNLLNTYGISKEDALSQAKKFFLIP